MALIELRNLSKTYDLGEVKVPALKQVSLEIPEGEFVALIGPSGSGKSTLMNTLGCLDRPTDGSYRLAGEEVAGMNPDQLAQVRNRRIGFIFQNFNLLARTTALENVETPLLYNRACPRRERQAAGDRNAQRVGLGDRVDHRPNQLSGGQQQRVAIARALVNRPPILLCDEPTGNLDTRTSREIMALLPRTERDGGADGHPGDARPGNRPPGQAGAGADRRRGRGRYHRLRPGRRDPAPQSAGRRRRSRLPPA